MDKPPLTAKVRLKLNRTEEKAFDGILKCCMYAYNQSLGYQMSQYVENGLLISKFDAITHLTEDLQAHPELRIVHRHVLNDAVSRANITMKNHNRYRQMGIADGFPREKNERRYRSFKYPGNQDFAVLPGRKLRLGKIGEVRYRGGINPAWRKHGNPKTCTIERDSIGRWYACIVYDLGDYERCTETFEEKTAVGVDVNVKNLATTSEGFVYPNHKRMEGVRKTIASISRKMSKCDEGSPKWEKHRRQLDHAYEKKRRAEEDMSHKISRELVDSHSLIVFEDIEKQKLIQKTESKSLRRSIAYVAWNRLFNKTSYKAAGANVKVVKVNPAYTSRICSRCGNDVPKTLDQRIHVCDRCGLVMDRDINAARNILNLGLGCRPLSPSG